MRSLTATIGSALRGVERVLLGREKSPTESGIFHRLSLIAFFAWVGLGADGLSSSCYGPEEAFLALQGHGHLTIFLALATAATVAIIAASYTQIIQLFPGGGGGYIVATKLLSPTAGVISGSALVVDYVLTIAVSIASGVDALLSFSSHANSPYKLLLCLVAILFLVTLNLRGLKESVRVLLPIFLLFVATHVVLIFGSLASHARELPGVFSGSISGTRESIESIGFWTTLFIFLRAFSMGAGTFTGIEAVSNGLPVLREPRVRTGKRTMLYLALSLAITAGGILIAYRLFGITHQPGRTLNATLLHRFTDSWNAGPIPIGAIFVFLALLAEGSLLFVAAQTGFVDGPRVLSSMAIDRWVPNRFANLSSRLVTRNGVLVMGVAAAAALIYARAGVKHLVVMYSINVFVTFTLSQFGMVRHWWQVRTREKGWQYRLLLNGTGMTISLMILLVTVSLKFFQGGWVTVLVTGSVVLMAFLVRRHYRRVGFALTMLNLLVEDSFPAKNKASATEGRVVAVFVNRYDGLGLHTLGRAQSLIGTGIRKVIFLSVIQVDSDQLRNEEHLESLKKERLHDLDRYETLVRKEGIESESHCVFGTDVVEELFKLSVQTAKREPDALFVAGQVVFERETISSRLLHNEVAFALQKRLIFAGVDVVVLPVKVPEEIW
jgi:amino acid transporter